METQPDGTIKARYPWPSVDVDLLLVFIHPSHSSLVMKQKCPTNQNLYCKTQSRNKDSDVCFKGVINK